MKALMAQGRAAHLLVRPAEEWDSISDELYRAYDGKDDELIELLHENFLAQWQAVTRNLLAEPLGVAGITVGQPVHPWAIASLERGGHPCEPLLCFLDDELPDAREAAAVYGGLQLQHFDDVMAGYESCLQELLHDDAV